MVKEEARKGLQEGPDGPSQGMNVSILLCSYQAFAANLVLL